MLIRSLITLITLLLLAGCSSGGGSGGATPSQGARILGMDVKDISPTVNYATAYAQAMATGVREVSISLDWNSLENNVGVYDNSLPDVIDSFYPSFAGDITLVLRPLDTPGPRLPTDLTGNFDDQNVITAFENFLTNLHSRLSTLNTSSKLKWIHIGNEIDANLGSDSKKRAQWQTFFLAAKAKVKNLWGNDVNVSNVVQFSVLNDAAKRARYLIFLTKMVFFKKTD